MTLAAKAWQAEPPPRAPITLAGWGRVALRGSVLGIVVFGGLGILLVGRLLEKPLFGLHRPWTPFITQGVCKAALAILGMGYHQRGPVMQGPGAMVANHCSWLDIFALNAAARIYFVSKAEVARWPAIGWLAKATGTLFINRAPAQAAAHKHSVETRLMAGHRLLLFPEGTSTDGHRVLPFKSTLFAAFFTQSMTSSWQIQPITLRYRAPAGKDARFYGWWGAMAFLPHLLDVLATPHQGAVEVICLKPLKVADFPNRKALAAHCERAIRHAHKQGAGTPHSKAPSLPLRPHKK
ncbi:MAG: 1-acyl-sn-glycerol-3-phosphate acyltransferase [Rhodobacteraceae bacterium]|nr:1-acyl-sn-glycerol-3-phosphate acyltransferase [Paracoccaceae bacterium]